MKSNETVEQCDIRFRDGFSFAFNFRTVQRPTNAEKNFGDQNMTKRKNELGNRKKRNKVQKKCTEKETSE